MELLLHTPLQKYVGYRYQHMFTPAQLSFLVNCLDATRNVPGTIFEVGCAAGMTTVWLNKHLDSVGPDRQYVSVDTFSGFVDRDVEHEIKARGKALEAWKLRQFFSSNDRRWVDRTLRRNHITRVSLIEADAVTFDYSPYDAISFALVDVDLYLPVKATLDRIRSRMAKGGIIVVDDCAPGRTWDGALQAYVEFVNAHSRAPEIVLDKLGVLRF
jgi:predicted O-methyltransferase YrrM